MVSIEGKVDFLSLLHMLSKKFLLELSKLSSGGRLNEKGKPTRIISKHVVLWFWKAIWKRRKTVLLVRNLLVQPILFGQDYSVVTVTSNSEKLVGFAIPITVNAYEPSNGFKGISFFLLPH